MPKISVIIPCYNVEQYITKCLDSVCNQTLKDIEIICIDDCSTDATLKKLQEYQKKDERIILIKHNKNKGVSISRNEGIKKSSGEYIGFVDSDDYIDLDFFNKLYKKAKEEHSDITKGRLVFVKNKQQSIDCLNEKIIKSNKFNLLYGFYCCIYKKSLLLDNNIYFNDDLIYGEDSYFLLQSVMYSKKIAIVDDIYYYYVSRPGSADSEILSEKHFLSGIEYIKKSIEFLNNSSCSEKEYVQAIRHKFDTLYGYNKKTKKISNKQLIAKTACDLWESVKYKHLFFKNNFIDFLDNHDVQNVYLLLSDNNNIKISPLLVKKITDTDIKYYLFGIISVLKIRKKYIPYRKIYYRLFNIFPLLGVKYLSTYSVFYIFGFIPVFRKNITNSTISNLVSVIIPVYKVEKYLEKCVESVIKQTYKDLEIILVDDGSPDSCPKICDDLAKTDKRIFVIHKKNGGLSSARNAGLDVATGKYIYFLDSDDYIEPETLDIMLKTMQTNNVDIVIAGVQPFYNGRSKPKQFDDMVGYFETCNKKQTIKSKEILKMPAVAWGKLYKKDIIDKYNLRFDEGLINEDEAFNWYYNTKIKSGIFIPNKFYNYLIRQDSIMGRKQNNGEKLGDILHIFDNIYNHLIKYNLYKKYSRIFRECANNTINYTKDLAQKFDNEKLVIECDKKYIKYNKRGFIERLIYDGEYKFIERIFSVKNTRDGKYKVICIFGIKIKFKR